MVKYNQRLISFLKLKSRKQPKLKIYVEQLQLNNTLSWGMILNIERILKGDINRFLVIDEYNPKGFKRTIGDAHNYIYKTLRKLSGRVHYKWDKENCKFWINGKLFTYDKTLINGKVFIYDKKLASILLKKGCE